MSEHCEHAAAVCTQRLYFSGLQHKGTMSTKRVFEKVAKICGHRTFVLLTPSRTVTIIDKITIRCN